jgi:hypothetical protein
MVLDRSFARIRRAVGVFAAAVDASAAVNARRHPEAQTLRTLGIDPDAFDRVRL